MERPKRRKSKDNPYTIEERDGKYIVSFVDGEQKSIEVEVSKEIYECFDVFELDDLSQMNEYDRHAEHSLFGDYPVTIRFSKKKNEEVEGYVLGLLLDTYNERIKEKLC